MNRNTGILECWKTGVLKKHYSINPLLHYSRKTWKKIVLVLGLSTWAVLAFAQVTASARIDSTRILIGDQVEVQLFLNSNMPLSNIRTDLSDFDSLTFVEVLEKSDWNPVSNSASSTVFEQTLRLTSFEAGQHLIPAFSVIFSRNGKVDTVKTGTLQLDVATIAVTDSTQLAPIKNIIEEPRKLEDFLPYLIGLLVMVILAGLTLLLIRLSKGKELPPPPPIILKPHEIALQKLEQLRAARLWQDGKIKAFQTELTFIIREYLEHQFQIPALENTTDEIISSLRKIGFSSEWQQRFRSLFQNADLVKFAKAEPPISIHEEGLNEAIALVQETKPVEEPIQVNEK